jgi:hypothetical protein
MNMELTRYATIQQSARHPLKTSGAYRFISTKEVLGHFEVLGWTPASVSEARTRIPENEGYQGHLIRLRSDAYDQKHIGVGDAYPEIVLKNSHNGTSAFHVIGGIFEKICGNGLCIFREKAMEIRMPHVGFSPWMVDAAVSHLAHAFPEAFDQRQRWRQIGLRPDEALAFADAAATLRFENSVDPRELLRPNRWQQAEPTLWNVLNTVQENIIRGGVRQVRSDGSSFRSRPVRDLSEDVRINRELWRLASELETAIN